MLPKRSLTLLTTLLTFLSLSSWLPRRVCATVDILTENDRSWRASLPLVIKDDARKKNWSVEGQTGWTLNGEELQMDLAFIVTTTDDGVDPTETFEDDDVVTVAWVIPTN